MNEDLSEFHDVFFEEADELIESMEAELLDMLTDPDDPERINTVFRAAHSIKGGSATFGFSAIAEFTHVMETLMDEVREGTRKASAVFIDLLLKSTDCVRTMMEAAKLGEQADEAVVAQLKGELEAELNSGTGSRDVDADSAGTQKISTTPEETTSSDDLVTYNIRLKPARNSFKTANDPITIFTELGQLGELTVSIDDSELPDFESFDPEDLYLAWELVLVTREPEKMIRDVFDWIDANSEIVIESPDSGLVDEVDDLKDTPQLLNEDSAADEPTSDGVAFESDVQKGETAAAELPKPAKAKPKSKTIPSIRVGIDKIDKLINLVGELVITQSMLNEEGGKLPGDLAEKLHEGLSQLQRYTRELQENVMQIRMVPISNAFNRLPRMIHDLTGKLGKKVELTVTGENTELDKTVLESIGDPLVHLVRNAVDHGLEMPDVRAASGKAETGELQLKAYHEGGNIVIEICDDGGGIDCRNVLRKAVEKGLVGAEDVLPDADVFELLFHPGFSMAEQVSDVSGRGVGMDVVRRNIQSLGGSVEVNSTLGVGTTFTIRLPLTLAIVDGQLARVGNQTFVFPLISIVESIQLDRDKISAIAGRGVLYRLRDDYLPLIRLANLFSLSSATDSEMLVVVVETGSGKVGLLVDDLLAQQQVVIKSLESNYRKIDGISGATILGDGTVALILDIKGVNTLFKTVVPSETIAA